MVDPRVAFKKLESLALLSASSVAFVLSHNGAAANENAPRRGRRNQGHEIATRHREAVAPQVDNERECHRPASSTGPLRPIVPSKLSTKANKLTEAAQKQ